MGVMQLPPSPLRVTFGASSVSNINPQLEAALVRMAKAHGLSRVQQRLEEGKFGDSSEQVRRWLRPRLLAQAAPRIGAFVVGAATVSAAVVSCFK